MLGFYVFAVHVTNIFTIKEVVKHCECEYIALLFVLSIINMHHKKRIIKMQSYVTMQIHFGAVFECLRDELFNL